MTSLEVLQHAEQFLWPAVSLALGLILARKLGSDLRPVFVGIIAGLSAQAQRYAYFFAYGLLIALAASLQELAKIAEKFDWKGTAALAEFVQPGLVTFIAFIPKPLPPADLARGPNAGTTPPFPPPPTTAD